MSPHRLLRHASTLVVGGCTLVLLCITGAGAAADLSPVRSGRPVAGIAVMRLGSSAATGLRHLPRYSYVVLGKSEYDYLPRIKRLSPATKVLGYESAPDLVDGCVPASWWCPGITYQQARAHDARHPHDHWILRTASGESLVNPHYPHSHLANVGSPSYQRAWARRVRTAATAGRFDGVMIDNILGLVSGWTGGLYPTTYPSDRAWERAMRGFIRFVGPALMARHLYVLANTFKGGANDGSTDVAWWKTVAPNVNGLMAEYWEQSPVDFQPFDTNRCCWTGHWDGWLRLAGAAQRSGADFFPMQHGSSTDTRAMAYGKASFLLVWDGSGGGYIFDPQSRADPWNPAWTIPIGKPRGPRRRVGLVWRRYYTRGVVLVNPHPARAQTVLLHKRYIGPTGWALGSVTLQPVSGMILRKG
jgi:Hypothetical glycosyl hydrolase family 15